MLDKKYALPAREQNGDLKAIGTFASQISDKANVREPNANGIMVIEEDGTPYYFRFSQSAKAAFKDGSVTTSSLGHLVVYESNYKDDDGVDQMRLVLGLPLGFSGSGFSGAEFKKAIITEALVPKTVSLAGINLVDLVA